MKRNHFVRSSDTTNIFKKNSSSLGKRRHLLSLSVFSVISVFITSMVLATSEPPTNSSQSQIIDLPNLPAEQQSISASTQSEVVALPIVKQTATVADITTTEETQDAELASTSPEQLALMEQQAMETSLLATDDSTTVIAESIAEDNTADLIWKEVTVKSGDNLSLIFPRVGLSARDVYNVAKLDKEIKPLLNLKPGQTLRFGLIDGDKLSLEQIELQLNPVSKFLISKTDDSSYLAKTETREVDVREVHATGTIVSSLFGAGKTAGLSDKLVMELAYIFGWDIDFALDLRENDKFKVIYTEEYLDGDKIADGQIIAAEFINQGKSFKAVRYTDENGLSRFYSPTGDSMRKAFNRTPVHFSRISSRFSPNRKHPKLKGVTRPHRGVDYAAKTGTPIMATGDGKVAFAGTKGGYGRTVVLSHGGKYTTLYAHMSRYKKGIRAGKRVRQGDVIGYVGMSGTATGPHLHYEFRVNGVHRNPLTVALPKAESLPKKYKADFDKKSAPLLAQLDLIRPNQLALND